jgi:hypothetical protein
MNVENSTGKIEQGTAFSRCGLAQEDDIEVDYK